MNYLILGGAGFLGRHLASALSADGGNVTVFDKTFPQNHQRINSVEYIKGDFLDEEELERALDGSNIIYHLISTTVPGSSNADPIYDVETNLVATLRMLNLVRRDQTKKIIFVSSGGTVYGEANTIPIDENAETNPVCSYGITKLSIEKYLHLYHILYGMDYCVFRLSNLFGKGQRSDRGQGAVAVFMDKAIKNEVVEIWGDGNIVRDYIYIDDAVAALLKARYYLGEIKVFNIGVGTGHSLNELLDLIEYLLEKPVKRNYNPARKLDVHQNVLDIARAEQFLNWTPKVSFEEGLRRTMLWMLKNQ